MSDQINVTIGATLGGTFRSAFSSATSQTNQFQRSMGQLQATAVNVTGTFTRMERSFTTVRATTNQLGGSFATFGSQVRVANSALDAGVRSANAQAAAQDRLTRSTRQATEAARQAANEQRRLNDLRRAYQGNGGGGGGMGGAISTIGMGYGINRLLNVGSDQEQAEANMQTSFMGRDGSVDKRFGSVWKQVKDLGGQLPGTTTDYAEVVTALRYAGMSLDNISKSGLTAAANIRNFFRTGNEEAGKFTANMSEAMGIKDADVAKGADIMARSRTVFGLDLEDMRAALTYGGRYASGLGIQGVGGSEDFMTAAGMAARQGMTGSVVGTELGNWLKEMNGWDRNLNKKVNAPAKDMLDKYGIKMRFFQRDGKFAGLENAADQMGKLNVLTEKERGDFMQLMWGSQGMAMANVMIKGGGAGFRQAKGDLTNAPGLDVQMAKRLGTSGAMKEAAIGATMNAAAAAVRTLEDDMKALWTTIGTFMERAADWIENNKELTAGAIKLGASMLALKVGFMAVGWAAGGFTRTWALLTTMLGVGRGKIAMTALKEMPLAMQAAGRAGQLFAAGLGMGLPALGLFAAAGVLIASNWDFLSGFATGTLVGFGNALKELAPVLAPIGAAIGGFVKGLMDLTSWTRKGKEGFDDGRKAGEAFGEFLGKALPIAGVLGSLFIIIKTLRAVQLGAFAASTAIALVGGAGVAGGAKGAGAAGLARFAPPVAAGALATGGLYESMKGVNLSWNNMMGGIDSNWYSRMGDDTLRGLAARGGSWAGGEKGMLQSQSSFDMNQQLGMSVAGKAQAELARRNSGGAALDGAIGGGAGARGAGGAAGKVEKHISAPITIYQQPGQDAEDLARLIAVWPEAAASGAGVRDLFTDWTP